MTPDLIVRVSHPDTGDFHLVLEVQSDPDPRQPERLATLAGHLRLKHGLPVVPVVVYLHAGRGRRPPPLDEHFLGLAFKVDFHEIVLPGFEDPVKALFDLNQLTELKAWLARIED
jgi:hypothetical protein